MKNLLYLTLLLSLLSFGCSKKSENIPQPVRVVNINGSGYPIVVIGGQTWTAANYNGLGGVNYDDSAVNIPTNGKLYTLAEAQGITLPPGWRLPTMDDINSLLSSIGVSEPPRGSTTESGARSVVAIGPMVYKLMSKTSWTTQVGNNSIGFNALAVGYYGRGFEATSSFKGKGIDAVFIMSTNYNGLPDSFGIEQYPSSNSAGGTEYIVLPSDRGSIRFVKDN